MSIVDIALILIFAVTVIVSAKKGFVRSVSGIVAWALAAVLTISFCAEVSDTIYDTVLKDTVTNAIDERVEVSNDAEDIASITSQTIQNLPEFVVSAAEAVGIDVEDIEKKSANFTVNERDIASALEEKVVGPIVRAATKAVVFVLMLLILSSLLAFLLKPVGKLVEKLPLIKQANTLLGAVLGLVKALLLLVVLSMLLELFAGFGENELSKAVGQSEIIKLIVESSITDTLFIK